MKFSTEKLKAQIRKDRRISDSLSALIPIVEDLLYANSMGAPEIKVEMCEKLGYGYRKLTVKFLFDGRKFTARGMINLDLLPEYLEREVVQVLDSAILGEDNYV